MSWSGVYKVAFLVAVVVLAFGFIMVVSVNALSLNGIVHDNGCERIMTVYSDYGQVIDEFYGNITLMRVDNDVAFYDYDGSCITIQGGTVIVKDVD